MVTALRTAHLTGILLSVSIMVVSLLGRWSSISPFRANFGGLGRDGLVGTLAMLLGLAVLTRVYWLSTAKYGELSSVRSFSAIHVLLFGILLWVGVFDARLFGPRGWDNIDIVAQRWEGVLLYAALAVTFTLGPVAILVERKRRMTLSGYTKKALWPRVAVVLGSIIFVGLLLVALSKLPVGEPGAYLTLLGAYVTGIALSAYALVNRERSGFLLAFCLVIVLPFIGYFLAGGT